MIERRFDSSEPVRPEPIEQRTRAQEHRWATRSWRIATGTLACPQCDAPVVPAEPLSPPTPLECPYCAHLAAARDFLSLAPPTRPTRVGVWLTPRLRLRRS
jgi:hypothetical protein